MKKRAFVRRLLALATAAVMLLSAVPAMAAFRDTAGHWAEKTLTEWQELGLIDGYSDGSFRPNAPVTRAEFVKLLNRALNFTAESAISFTDVKESDWFYAEAAKAAAAGYAQGSNGAFHPEQAITRAEAAAMIARAVNLTADEKRADAFADAAVIPAWAKGSVGAAAESGYMNGYPDGTFGAGNYITRAEAVVTLDRVRKDTQSVTVEKAGTTLENETVAGNLIIAASVGEGNVTLKNMTIRGDLIVRGGGANSVYLDNTKVCGSVRLQKENVHLRLMGGTTLGSVEISQPCRITRDGSFKGVLGTVVIDLEKASNKEIQIEVPAERVEVLSCANVALNADVEKLVLSADAEGTQLEVKRGATVGELTADAKAKLTGAGTVSSLVVSASDVTVSDSLSVKKTETTDGAKEPTVSGGSSGSSGRVLKEITGVAPITAEVPYGTSEAAALAALPETITLNVKDGSTVSATVTEWSWADGTSYEAKPAADTAYTATTAFTVPSGYTYSGAKTATATVTVKALDMSKFNAALTAAEAKLSEFAVVDNAADATDASKIYVVPNNTTPDAVTKDVKFVLEQDAEAYTTLKDAITKAKAAQPFATQADCNSLRDKLTTATANADNLATQTGTAYTNDYIKAQIKAWLDNGKATQTEWAISDAAWPLKFGHKAYTLPEKTNDMQLSANTTGEVALTWTIATSGWGDYLEIKAGSEADVKSVSVKNAPDAPMEITFKVSAADYGEIGTYTVTVGTPIALEVPQSMPQFLSVSDTCTFQLPLKGASAIESVTLSGAPTIKGNENPTGNEISINAAQIDNVEMSKDGGGVDLTVTIGTGTVGGVWRPNNDPPAHSVGKLLDISIDTSGFTLKNREEGNPGWYLPDNNKLWLNSMDVWVLTPVFTKVDSTEGTDTRSFRIHTQYMPGDAKVSVAFALKGVEPKDFGDSVIKAAATLEGNGVYLATFDKDVFQSGKEYNVWCRLNATDWVQTNIQFTVSNSGNNTPLGCRRIGSVD